MIARSQLPVFRLASTRGLLTMQELQAFAGFAEDMLSQTLTIDGVNESRPLGDGTTAITAPATINEGDATRATVIRRPQKPRHEFPRSGGIALWPHLRDFHDHLWSQLRDFRLRGSSLKATRKTGTAQRLEFGDT